MTPLRAAMIKAMQMHGFSERTHQSYLSAVTDVARYWQRSPDALSSEELDRYFSLKGSEPLKEESTILVSHALHIRDTRKRARLN